MQPLTKDQKTIIIGLVCILILGGIIYWATQRKEPKVFLPPEEFVPEGGAPGPSSLGAKILQINRTPKYLIVQSDKEEKEIKVNLTDNTEIIQLGLPFDPAHPPTDGHFNFEEKTISFEDLEIGDQVLIKTRVDTTGRTELNNVTQIQVLP